MKHLKKTILSTILITLLLATIATATPLTEDSGYAFTTNYGAYAQEIGINFTAFKNINLVSVEKNNGVDATTAKLFTDAYVELEETSFIGDVATFTSGLWNFSNGEAFIILIGNNGTTINNRWGTDAVSSAINGTNVGWKQTCDTNQMPDHICDNFLGSPIYLLQNITTETTMPSFCDTHPLALFCDDAETGTITDKWVLNSAPDFANYSTTKAYEGTQSIWLSPTEGGGVMYNNTQSTIQSPVRISFMAHPAEDLGGSNLYLFLEFNTNIQFYISGADLNGTAWNNVSIEMWNDTSGKIYVDGVEAVSSSIVLNGGGIDGATRIYLQDDVGSMAFYDNFLIQNYTPPTPSANYIDWLFNDTYTDTTGTHTFDVISGSSYTNITGTSNDGVHLPQLQINTSFGTTGDNAFCLWAKPTTWQYGILALFSTGQNTMVNIQDNGQNSGTIGNIWFVRTTLGITSDLLQNNSPSVGRWHSYCISYNTTSTILEGFIDGESAGTMISSGNGAYPAVPPDALYLSLNGDIGAVRYYNYTPSLSEIATWHNETFIYDAPTCNISADCSNCQFCSGNGCYFQYGTDFRNDCGTSFFSCGVGGHYRQVFSGICDNGGGECDKASIAVSSGNICINDTDYDVAPTSVNYCGIWSNCSNNGTIAPESYVGFTNDYSGLCDPSNPVISGTHQIASVGFVFNETAFKNTCSENAIPAPPSKFNYDAGDLAPTALDALIKGLIGIGKVALIIGLLAGLVVFVVAFAKLGENIIPANKGRKR